MHRYDCPQCGLTSEPFLRRAAAESKGAEHRDKRHDGMYPKGEGIVSESFRLPRRGELAPLLIVAALIVAGLVNKYL